MRRSLYVKDDDYRLCFLYGNFTTLTRFTELDVERVLDRAALPRCTSRSTRPTPSCARRCCATRAARRALRWLEVAAATAASRSTARSSLCPGVNDGAALERTLVRRARPLPRAGVARRRAPRRCRTHSTEPDAARPHPRRGRDAPSTSSSAYQALFGARRRAPLRPRRPTSCTSSRAASPPALEAYDSLDQAENGIGQWAALRARLRAPPRRALAVRPGFFQAVEGAPALGYRAPHGAPGRPAPRAAAASSSSPATYAAPLLRALLERAGYRRRRRRRRREPVLRREHRGRRAAVRRRRRRRAIERDGRGATYLLPDACLTNGRFLDGMALERARRAT